MKKITALIMLVTVVVLILWDVYALAFGGVDATISRIILETSRDNLMIPLVFGVLIGHFFWSQGKVE